MADASVPPVPPGPLAGTLNPDYIEFMRNAVHALRADRHTGAMHVAAVLALLSERLFSRADLNQLAAIGICLATVGTKMTIEALK